MKKSLNSILILVLIIVLLILIILSGVGVYVYISKKDKVVETQQQVTNIKTPSISELESAKNTEKILKIGPLYPLDPFTVNIRSEKGSVYLRVKLDFELSVKKLKNELDVKNAIIRDAIIRILSSKMLEDLSNDEGKEATVDEIINDINQILYDGYIKNVYFTEFIVQ